MSYFMSLSFMNNKLTILSRINPCSGEKEGQGYIIILIQELLQFKSEDSSAEVANLIEVHEEEQKTLTEGASRRFLKIQRREPK